MTDDLVIWLVGLVFGALVLFFAIQRENRSSRHASGDGDYWGDDGGGDGD